MVQYVFLGYGIISWRYALHAGQSALHSNLGTSACFEGLGPFILSMEVLEQTAACQIRGWAMEQGGLSAEMKSLL